MLIGCVGLNSEDSSWRATLILIQTGVTYATSADWKDWDLQTDG